MQARLDSGVTNLHFFCKITRRDGVVIGFTEYDHDLTYLGILYRATDGIARTAMQAKADLSIPNNEVTAPLYAGGLTALDIRAGRYDYARVQVFLAFPDDVNFATYGIIRLRSGFLGEIKIEEGIWRAEIRGLAYALQQSFIEVYTPTCQADFGDERCKFDLTTVTDTGHVTDLIDETKEFIIELDSTNAGGKYEFGLINWTGGMNENMNQEILTWSGGTDPVGTIKLWIRTGYNVQIGDTFSIQAGCAKTVDACVAYNNILNYRGFPYVPGLNFLLDYGNVAP